MTTCKDCIHYEVCIDYLCDEHFTKETNQTTREMFSPIGCENFKNKVDFEEVVECSNCKYAYFNKDVCAYSCKRRDYYSEFVRPTDYCSYGERSDT